MYNGGRGGLVEFFSRVQNKNVTFICPKEYACEITDRQNKIKELVDQTVRVFISYKMSLQNVTLNNLFHDIFHGYLYNFIIIELLNMRFIDPRHLRCKKGDYRNALRPRFRPSFLPSFRHTFVSAITDTPLHQSTPNLASILFGIYKSQICFPNPAEKINMAAIVKLI